MLDLRNYGLSQGELLSSRLAATNQGVILSAQNLATNMVVTLTIGGVVKPDGQPMPSETFTFNTGNLFWSTIGGAELGLRPEVLSVGTNGLDLFSGGIQQRDEYEEATFAGEAITGDFERIVRVHYVEPSSFGARAGLMVREYLDEGKPRPIDPTDPVQGFSRYVEIAVNAATTAQGEATGQGHMIVRRSESATSITETQDDGVQPQFPNVWLRVVRSGQTFSFFRGTNGVDWVRVSDETFATAFPDTAFVGVAFSPQNDDLPAGSLRKSFVAKFRDYKSAAVEPGNLSIKLEGDHAVLAWTGGGILESAASIAGPWSTAASQQNPQDVALAGEAGFFRLR